MLVKSPWVCDELQKFRIVDVPRCVSSKSKNNPCLNVWSANRPGNRCIRVVISATPLGKSNVMMIVLVQNTHLVCFFGSVFSAFVFKSGILSVCVCVCVCVYVQSLHKPDSTR